MQSCVDTKVESLDDIFVRSDQERAQLSIATELEISDPVFGKYIGAETALSFNIAHTKDTAKVEFYHSSFCDGDPVESLEVITKRSSSRIDYSEIKRNQVNYFSSKSFGIHGETIGCSNTIKFLQSSDASTLDFMIEFSVQDENCALEGSTLDSILTSCDSIIFDFEKLNDVVVHPLVSLKYYNALKCNGVESGSHNFSDDGLQDSFIGLEEGSGEYSFKFKDQRNKEVCVDFSVNKDTTAPVAVSEFSITSPQTLKVYSSGIQLSLNIEQVDPPNDGVLKLFNNINCVGDALYEKNLLATDTTVNATVNFESADPGIKNIYLYLEDKIGNFSCFAAAGVNYEVVNNPSFSIDSPVSPSDGENMAVDVNGIILGSNTQIFSSLNCAGIPWLTYNPAAAESINFLNQTLSPGGRHQFSFISSDLNSSTDCINTEVTHDVFWKELTAQVISSEVDTTPNFLLTNDSDEISDGEELAVKFYSLPFCMGDVAQTSTVEKSLEMSVESTNEIFFQADYLFSFSYTYDGITSSCSNTSVFTYKLPDVDLIKDGISYNNDSTDDPYLTLKINSLDNETDKIISVHKDPSCLLRGYSQKLVLSNQDSYESDTLQEFFLDGPKDYSIYIKYEDLNTGQSHCFEEASVTIDFVELNSYSDFFEVDGDGNVTTSKIDMYKHYELNNDINFVDKDFVPIGTNEAPFQGHFYGGLNVIKKLVLSSNNYNEMGFFGVLGEHSVVYELALMNGSISNGSGSAYSATGMLAGKSSGTIERVFVDSDTVVIGKDNSGSLVGHAAGATVRLCESFATVVGEDNVGGLVGFLDGPKLYEYTESFPPTSVIVNSSSRGDVTGKFSVGGLIGKMTGVVGHSFSSGDVEGEENVGGLIGEVNVYQVSIFHSFSTSTATSSIGSGVVAGLVGLNNQTVNVNGIIENSFHTQGVCYNYNPSSPTAKARCEDGNTDSIIDISNLTSDGACNLLYFGCDGAFSVTAGSLPRIDYTGISEATRNNLLNLDFGKGTRSDPLIIETEAQWLGLEGQSVQNHLHTILSDDLTFDNDPDNFQYKPFNDRLRNYRFTGVLDGRHFSLKSITYDQNFLNNQRYGLLIGSSLGGEVKNLHMKNSSIDGHSYTGLISSSSVAGRFKSLSFENINLNFDGGYTSFVTGGFNYGDKIYDISIIGSNFIASGVGNGSYNGLISSWAAHSSFQDIIIRDSTLRDSETTQLNFSGMVVGRSGYWNQFDFLSVDVDISLSSYGQYIGGVTGWAWLSNNFENSVIKGTIVGGDLKLGGFVGGGREVYFKNTISEIDISGNDGAVYCGGLVGNVYKVGSPEHSSIRTFNSVSKAKIKCSGGVNETNHLSSDHLNFAFNHYYQNNRAGYNFWFDVDTDDHVESCFRADLTGEGNAPCTSIESLGGVFAPSYAPGTMEYFFEYFFFETTINGGAEFSEDNWLDLGGSDPRVKGHSKF